MCHAIIKDFQVTSSMLFILSLFIKSGSIPLNLIFIYYFFFFQCGRSFNPRFLFTWPTAQVAMDTVEDMVSMCCAEVSLFWFLWFFFFSDQ